MSNLHLKLIYLQEKLNMTDSDFYWFLYLLNQKGIITITDIINNETKNKEVLDE